MFPELIPDAKAHIPSATNGTERIMNIIPMIQRAFILH